MVNKIKQIFKNSEEEYLKKEILLLREENIRLKADITFWQNKFWEILEAYNKIRDKDETNGKH